METTVIRRRTSFRFKSELLSRLKNEAKKADKSLNSFVEAILYDSLEHVPNVTTRMAISETQSGKYAGTIDMSSYDSFIKSLD